MNDTKPIVVDPWTVTMAIRYGLGRSLAHADAIGLIRKYWAQLDESARFGLMRDLDWHKRWSPWPDVQDSSVQTLEWCEQVETSRQGKGEPR